MKPTFYWTANKPSTPAFVPQETAPTPTPATPGVLPLTLPAEHPLVAEADARVILATPVAEDAEPVFAATSAIGAPSQVFTDLETANATGEEDVAVTEVAVAEVAVTEVAVADVAVTEVPSEPVVAAPVAETTAPEAAPVAAPPAFTPAPTPPAFAPAPAPLTVLEQVNAQVLAGQVDIRLIRTLWIETYGEVPLLTAPANSGSVAFAQYFLTASHADMAGVVFSVLLVRNRELIASAFTTGTDAAGVTDVLAQVQPGDQLLGYAAAPDAPASAAGCLRGLKLT